MVQLMQRFELHRDIDESGISGTGLVAEGVKFTDGKAVLRWRTKHQSTGFYDSMEDLDTIHGHDGKTRIVWIDEPLAERKATIERLLVRATGCPPSEGTDCALAAIHALGPVVLHDDDPHEEEAYAARVR